MDNLSRPETEACGWDEMVAPSPVAEPPSPALAQERRLHGDMERPVETSTRSGAHFLRHKEGKAPIFVPASPGTAALKRARHRGRCDDRIVGGVAAEPERARRRGRELLRSGRIPDLADFAEALEREAWSRGNHRTRVIARLLSGRAALEAGRVRPAAMRFEALVDHPLHPRHDTLDLLDDARVGLGRVALAEGRPEKALRHFREALSGRAPRDRSSGRKTTIAAARRGLGAAYTDLKCPSTAVTELRRALRRAREAEAHFESALAASRLAVAEIHLRGPDSDRPLPRLALAAADFADSPLARIEALRARAAGRRAAAREDASRRAELGEEALTDLREALAAALRTGSVLRQARVKLDTAAVLDVLGRPGRADARRMRARDLLDPAPGRG